MKTRVFNLRTMDQAFEEGLTGKQGLFTIHPPMAGSRPEERSAAEGTQRIVWA